MADVFSPEQRTSIMKKVRSAGNSSTELKLIEVFKELSIKGWRRKYDVCGHPDFVFLRKRIAVFVDGCFWHGHDCRNTRPSSNQEYWQKKRERNIQHDSEVTKIFLDRGWIVIRIWECELKRRNRQALLKKLSVLMNQ